MTDAKRETQPILVVDDDMDLLEMMELVLDSVGYLVVTAKNGQEALSRLEELRPSLILLDMKMPIMDGWEFVAHYRRLHDRRSPIVVVTAAQDARKWANQVAADGFLAKPFDISDLLSTVRDYVGPAPAWP